VAFQRQIPLTHDGSQDNVLIGQGHLTASGAVKDECGATLE
jgi:hypothetical protein